MAESRLKSKVKTTEKEINKELYKTVLLDEYIYLKPTDLNFKINDIILTKLNIMFSLKKN